MAIVSINNVESTNFPHEYDSSLKLDVDLKLPRISLIPSHFPSVVPGLLVKAHSVCSLRLSWIYRLESIQAEELAFTLMDFTTQVYISKHHGFSSVF